MNFIAALASAVGQPMKTNQHVTGQADEEETLG
jgi:hypothetical protein